MIVGHLFETGRQSVGVLRTHGLQRAQHDEIERALQQLELTGQHFLTGWQPLTGWQLLTGQHLLPGSQVATALREREPAGE